VVEHGVKGDRLHLVKVLEHLLGKLLTEVLLHSLKQVINVGESKSLGVGSLDINQWRTAV